MKKLENQQLEMVIAGDGNCRGIYDSCLWTAALAGMVGVASTAGIGIAFAVLGGGAAMEYCRQQYIGCIYTNKK
jgi:hypothetical protein